MKNGFKHSDVLREYRFYQASEGKVHIIAEFSRCVTYDPTVNTLAKALPMEGVVSMERQRHLFKKRKTDKKGLAGLGT